MADSSIQQNLELAVQHHRAGRLAQAEQLYRQVLSRQPGNTDALHLLGVVVYQAGGQDSAVDLIRQAISLRPDYPEALGNLGMILIAQGRLDEAIAAYRQAIALQPSDPAAHNNLGNALTQQDRLDEAIAEFRRAIELKSDYSAAHSNLGNALLENGCSSEGIAAHRRAIELRPDYAEAHNNLGKALSQQGQLDEAIAEFRRAISLKPDLAQAHSNLGNALGQLRRLDEAIVAVSRAIALMPSWPEAHFNLGNILAEAGRLDDAIASFRRAISLKPTFAEAHHICSLVLLVQGKFSQAWDEYEWRWQCKNFPSPPRNFPQPLWDGSPLHGRTILLHAEQGFGDAIQFVRYLPMVIARGGHVILECPPALHRLLQTIAGGCPIVARGQPLPKFDLHCPLLSLPKAFATTLDTIPRIVPYLHPQSSETEKWRQRLTNDSLNVGLAWAGRPTHNDDADRSMPLPNLALLAQVPNVRFYSLQKGPAAEAHNLPRPMHLIDWTDELSDFADTAALIASLDLVISVDTAVAHLAGALAKPVWTLLPFAPDWRWLLDRPDTPWYPTMRLFRQPSPGDWNSVLRQTAQSLAALAEHLTNQRP